MNAAEEIARQKQSNIPRNIKEEKILDCLPGTLCLYIIGALELVIIELKKYKVGIVVSDQWV